MLNSSHGVAYQAPVGRGFSADDLQTEQLRQLGEQLTVILPTLLDEGVGIYVAQIRQEQAMKALEQKLQESLAPEHRKPTHDLFRRRAEEQLQTEAKAAELAKAAAAIEAIKAAEVKVAKATEARR